MNALKWIKNWKFLVVLAIVLLATGIVISFWRSPRTALLVVGAIVAALVLWIVVCWLVDMLQARWASKRLERELENQPTYLPADIQETNPAELKKKFRDALQTLRDTLGKSFLYELPWYLLMGEAGSGKTTSLRKSGIRWPLGGEQQGIGGTVNCDWWFANDAVILDTAGRFAVHEKDSPVVPVWDNFLKLLKRLRPRKPIDGVVIAIPADSLIATEQERDRLVEEAKHKAQVLHDKLSELQRKLQLVFPVYILVTKCDKVRGFEEFFTLLSPQAQGSLFGWGNPRSIDEPFKIDWMDEVYESTTEDLLRLRATIQRDGETPENSDLIFLFPEEFQALRPVLAVYLEKIFEYSRYEEPHRFRGLFFSSGGQDQMPLSSLIELERRERPASPPAAGRAQPMGTMMIEAQDDLFGRPYFVHDFYTKKVFKESGLCRPSRKVQDSLATVRRFSQIGAAALSVAGLVFFIWQFFAESGAYDEISVQLARVESATSATNRSGQIFLDYEAKSEDGTRTVNELVDAYEIMKRRGDQIDAGDREEIYRALDRIFWLGLANVVDRGNAHYAAQALGRAEDENRFVALPRQVESILDTRRKFRDLKDTGARIHDIVIRLLGSYGEVLSADLVAMLRRFDEDPSIHEASYGDPDLEVDEGIIARVDKAFRDEDTRIVRMLREAYERRTDADQIFAETRAEEGYLFGSYREVYDLANRLRELRSELIANQQGSSAEIASIVLECSIVYADLEAAVKDINDRFGAALAEEQKKDDTLKGRAEGLLEDAFTRRRLDDGPVGFLLFEAFDPKGGRVHIALEKLAALTKEVADWPLEDLDLAGWQVREEDRDALFTRLLRKATDNLKSCQVNIVNNERLDIDLHDATRSLLTKLHEVGRKASENGEFLKSPVEVSEDLEERIDRAFLDFLAADPAASRDLDQLLKEMVAEYTEIRKRGLPSSEEAILPSAVSELNRALVKGSLGFHMVEFWVGVKDWPRSVESPQPLSRSLAELLRARDESMDKLLRDLSLEKFAYPTLVFDNLRNEALLQSRELLAQLKATYNPDGAFVPAADRGFSNPLSGRFLDPAAQKSLFDLFFADNSGELTTSWQRKLRDYLNKGEDAYAFMTVFEPDSQDDAVREYEIVRAAYAKENFELLQKDEFQRLGAYLTFLRETRAIAGKHGVALAHRLEQTIQQAQTVNASSSVFYERQLARLMRRTESELRSFLARSVIQETNDLLDTFEKLCDGRFPFEWEAARDGVSLEEFSEFLGGDAAPFYAGVTSVNIETRSYTFDDILGLCEDQLRVGDNGAFLDRFRAFIPRLAGDVRSFVIGDRKFSLFFRPETGGGDDGSELQEYLDLFSLKIPGEVSFVMCSWGAPSRNQLWIRDRASYGIDKKLHSIEFTLGTDAVDVSRLLFDSDLVSPFAGSDNVTLEIKKGDNRCDGVARPDLKSTRLDFSSPDGWWLMRFIRLFGGEPWTAQSVTQEGPKLPYELSGHHLVVPLALYVGGGNPKPLRLHVVLSFWRPDGTPGVAPDFAGIYEEFEALRKNAWTVESLNR